MIDKIKGWINAFLASCLVLLGGIAWVLFSKNRSLSDQVSKDEAEKQLGDTLSKLTQDEKQVAGDGTNLDTDMKGVSDAINQLSDSNKPGTS